MVKKSLFGRIGFQFSYLLLAYVILAGMVNQIIILGNDHIADAVDCVLGGQALQLRRFLLSLLWMAAAGAALSYFKSLSGNSYSAKVQKEVRETLAKHLVKMPFAYFDEKGSGSVLTKLPPISEKSGDFFRRSFRNFS